jgi:hypothetical protein
MTKLAMKMITLVLRIACLHIIGREEAITSVLMNLQLMITSISKLIQRVMADRPIDLVAVVLSIR